MKKAFNIPQAFIGFLTASLLFWLLMNLSKEYTTDISLSIKYQNLDQDKIIQNTPRSTINITIKGNGFKLIGAKFTSKTLLLDLKKLQKKTGDNYYLLSSNHKNEIQKQLKSGLTIVSISQDSIHFKISKLQSKNVRVEPMLNITYKKGFGLAAPIEISPDSILLSGTAKDLKNINAVYTEKIDLLNISDNISEKLSIKLPERIKARYHTASIKLNIDKFTEGKIEVPITIKNLPKNESINIFPKTVTVTYKVGLKNFNKVNANSFDVFCDYKQSVKKDLSYLVPTINIKTELISSVRMFPNKIDFLIHK